MYLTTIFVSFLDYLFQQYFSEDLKIAAIVKLKPFIRYFNQIQVSLFSANSLFELLPV